MRVVEIVRAQRHRLLDVFLRARFGILRRLIPGIHGTCVVRARSFVGAAPGLIRVAGARGVVRPSLVRPHDRRRRVIPLFVETGDVRASETVVFRSARVIVVASVFRRVLVRSFVGRARHGFQLVDESSGSVRSRVR